MVSFTKEIPTIRSLHQKASRQLNFTSGKEQMNAPFRNYMRVRIAVRRILMLTPLPFLLDVINGSTNLEEIPRATGVIVSVGRFEMPFAQFQHEVHFYPNKKNITNFSLVPRVYGSGSCEHSELA